MSKKLYRSVVAVLLAAFVLVCAPSSPFVTTCQAEDPYEQLLNATTIYGGYDYSNEYNAYYYYMNYPDLQAAFGMDPFALVMHYALYGRFEGRIANRLIYSRQDIVPSGTEDLTVINITRHDNGGMTANQEKVARSKAQQIATQITKAAALYESQLANSSSTSKKSNKATKVTEVEKVAYAAGVVQAYCERGTYTTSGKNYRTAYGVFVAGEYSSEGATRALGLILDYMGILWEHANLGSYADQWCKVIVDGQEGYADPTTGVAGYGRSSLEGGNGKDISFKDVRSKFSVF